MEQKIAPKKEIFAIFQPERLKAPFMLRCTALVLDYLLVVAFPAITLLISRFTGYDGTALLNSELNNIGWLISILFTFSNLVLLPAASGRTIGKFVTGITIVGMDGKPPNISSMLLRQTIGYLLIPATGGLGFLLSALNSKGRALHDYLAGTVVIFANMVPLNRDRGV